MSGCRGKQKLSWEQISQRLDDAVFQDELDFRLYRLLLIAKFELFVVKTMYIYIYFNIFHIFLPVFFYC